jgi:hypothetical protein
LKGAIRTERICSFDSIWKYPKKYDDIEVKISQGQTLIFTFHTFPEKQLKR